MDTVAVPRQGKAFTRTTGSTIAQETSVKTALITLVASAGTLPRQRRGGCWLFLRRTVIRLIGFVVHLLPGLGEPPSLCLSEIKHAHTDDEVRQEMA